VTEGARRIWAVVPVKAFEAAKSRLAPDVSPAERERLAESMFQRVSAVLSRSPELSGVLVVTDSARVAAVADRLGVASLRDPEAAPTLAHCIDHALEELRRRGATHGLVVVSDLPALADEDVQGLVERLKEHDVVIAPDKGGHHTNALALRLEPPIRTSFGSTDSLRRHGESAERAGLSIGVFVSPSLAFDVDTPEDYAEFVNRNRASRVNFS